MSDLEEKKSELILDLSNVLNDTGAYLKIIDVVYEKYGIDMNDYDHVFTYIEEVLSDMILNIEDL
jgi:uncharacterized protein YfbU (UPF0304 family)